MLGIIAAAMTAIIGALIWYLKYTTKRQAEREDKQDLIQKEERIFNRNIITNELKALHKDGQKNARLNRKSIFILKSLAEYFNKYFNHNDEKVNFKKKDKKANGQKK